MCAPCVSCCSAKVIQLIVRASWSLGWEGALRKDQAGPETEGKNSGQRNSSSCLNTEQDPGGEEITPLQAVLVPVGWRGRLATPSHTSEVGVSCCSSSPPCHPASRLQDQLHPSHGSLPHAHANQESDSGAHQWIQVDHQA